MRPRALGLYTKCHSSQDASVKGIAKNPASNSWRPVSMTHYRAATVSQRDT